MGQISVPTTHSPALLCRGQPAQAYAVAQRPCKKARVVEQSGWRMVCEVMGQVSRQGWAISGSLISGVKRLRVKSRGAGVTCRGRQMGQQWGEKEKQEDRSEGSPAQ